MDETQGAVSSKAVSGSGSRCSVLAHGGAADGTGVDPFERVKRHAWALEWSDSGCKLSSTEYYESHLPRRSEISDQEDQMTGW